MAGIYPWLVPRVILPVGDYLTGRRLWHNLAAMRRAQWCSREELEEKAASRLRALLRHAGTHVPYFRDLFAGAGFDPEAVTSAADLRHVPVSTRADVRASFPGRALAENLPSGRSYRRLTSGSTGQPLEFRGDRAAVDNWMASYLFFREWADAPLWLTRFQIAAPPHFYEDPASVTPGLNRVERNALLRRALLGERVLRFGGDDISPSTLMSGARKHGRRGYFLFAFPSYASKLAGRILHEGIELPSWPQVVISYAETLTPAHQALLEQGFRSRVVNHYSTLEVLHMAQTCPDCPDYIHVNTERALIRVVTEDQKDAPPGASGRIVITDLANEMMPFINYDTGDRGIAGEPCPCGRGFPTLMQIEGREAELLRTPSGRVVSPGTLGRFLVHWLGVHGQILEYQAVQNATDSVTLLVVPAPLFRDTLLAQLAAEMEAWLGPGMAISVVPVDQIDPEPSGKRPSIKPAFGSQ